jgi:RimJ/RimL family protein N-acetyltransferase
MLTIRRVALNEMEALAESHAAFQNLTRLGIAEGGVLPSEFVAEFLPRARAADPWLGVWAVDDGVVVGSGGFKSAPLEGVVEIGYGVARSVEGQGVATAIAKAMVSFAMEHGARAVIAHTLPDGFASQRVLAKAGFTLVGPVIDPEDGDVLRFTYNKL